MANIFFSHRWPTVPTALLYSALVFVSSPAIAEELRAGKPPGPEKILTVDQSEVDCGPALPGQILKHRFLLTNHTKQSVKFLGVTPSCSDVYADSPETIAPGSTLSYTMTFHAGLSAGDNYANTVIRYQVNGQESPDVVKLKMAAHVGTLLSLGEKRLDFGALPVAPRPSTREIVLQRGTSALEWDSLVATRMSAGLLATIVPGQEGSQILRVSVNTRDTGIGCQDGEVAIGFVKDGVRLLPEITVPVTYETTAIVRSKPKSIFLGGVRVGESKSAQIAVVADREKPLTFVDAFVEPRDFFEVVASEEERVINFTVSCHADAVQPTSKAMFRAIVRVEDEEYTVCAPIIFKIIPKQ